MYLVNCELVAPVGRKVAVDRHPRVLFDLGTVLEAIRKRGRNANEKVILSSSKKGLEREGKGWKKFGSSSFRRTPLARSLSLFGSFVSAYNLTSGFGFPLQCSMNEAVEPRMISESRSLTMNTGWLEDSRSLRSAGVTEGNVVLTNCLGLAMSYEWSYACGPLDARSMLLPRPVRPW